MANQVTNYKCPACTGPLHFVGTSGKLECDYCGSTYEIADIEKMFAADEDQAVQAHAAAEAKAAELDETPLNEGEWDDSGLEQWGVEEGMKAYNCSSCGAQLICDETTAATSCPYCGNPTVVPGQFSGGLKPNYILPFKLDQKAAQQALQDHYKGKRLLPSGFAKGNKLKEVKGVYVPFWLFDGTADVDAVFTATNTRVFRDGDYEVKETDHYNVRRAGTVPFKMIPVDASSKMPDGHMDAIEPYDYSDLREFSTAYLPGFLADKYDVSSEESASRADERAVNTAIAAMQNDVTGYEAVIPLGNHVNLKRERVQYAMLPVYMLGTTWEGEKYLFAMNGQTGKLIGDLPVDRGKLWKYFAGIAASVTAVLGTILFMVL